MDWELDREMDTVLDEVRLKLAETEEDRLAVADGLAGEDVLADVQLSARICHRQWLDVALYP